MVVRRSCSFCAGEIEPGTGMMFVRRDGAVLYFCSAVCRKDQLNLGRVGHRLKWTRAYATRKALEKARPSAAPAPAAPSEKPKPKAAAGAPPKTGEKKATTAAKPPAKPATVPSTPPSKPATAKATAPAKPAPKPAEPKQEKSPAKENPSTGG